MKYAYKGCQVTISATRTAEDRWKYNVLVEPEPYVGTIVGEIPEESFETEEEAIQAGKRATERRIDNRRVKPTDKGAS